MGKMCLRSHEGSQTSPWAQLCLLSNYCQEFSRETMFTTQGDKKDSYLKSQLNECKYCKGKLGLKECLFLIYVNVHYKFEHFNSKSQVFYIKTPYFKKVSTTGSAIQRKPMCRLHFKY